MKKKGFTIVELLSVLVVVAIIILLAVPAYGRVQKSINERNRQNEIDLIEVAAAKYANDYNVSAMFVEELIMNGYIQPNNKENIVNPADESDIWNCNVITITKKNNLKYAKFTNNKEVNEDKTCNYNKLNELNQNLVINMYEYNGTKGNKITNETEYWTNKNVLLELEFKNEKYSLENAKVKWYEDVRELDKKEKELVVSISNDEILRKIYKAEVEVENNGKKEIFKASVFVLIDKIRPGFYSDDKVEDGKGEKWLTETSYTTKAYDDGSGIYGYKLSEENIDCNNTTYTKGKKIKIVKNGKYYICIKDIAGNTTEQAKELELKYIDSITKEEIGTYIEFEGTKGNIVDNNQWYIKDDVTIKLNAKKIGDSGGNYYIKNNTTNEELLKNTDYVTRPTLMQNVTYNKNSNGNEIYGKIINKAEIYQETTKKLYYERKIEEPTVVVKASHKDITVELTNVVEPTSGLEKYIYTLYDEEKANVLEVKESKEKKITFEKDLKSRDEEIKYNVDVEIISKAGNRLTTKLVTDVKVPAYCSKTVVSSSTTCISDACPTNCGQKESTKQGTRTDYLASAYDESLECGKVDNAPCTNSCPATKSCSVLVASGTATYKGEGCNSSSGLSIVYSCVDIATGVSLDGHKKGYFNLSYSLGEKPAAPRSKIEFYNNDGYYTYLFEDSSAHSNTSFAIKSDAIVNVRLCTLGTCPYGCIGCSWVYATASVYLD